ncbi:MAG: DUF3179 domain-containing protein [Rhodospirillales bacterium]|nr:DUF3179 domain-containing protein [Rhodospirillales bacterium]
MFLAVAGWLTPALANPDQWRAAWPRTDFTRHTVPFGEIFSGGPPKDGIPAIDNPRFIPIAEITGLKPTEPVLTLEINGDVRAYPLRILIWHEIVNDTVGGVPVAVTYCPLCNSAVAFDRRLGGRTLDFGVSGMLRHSDLVMYDRQTESWWQQFLGEAIIGQLTGARLDMLPVRAESVERFRARFPAGKVLIPTDPAKRPYGQNPYVGYDRSAWPFLFRGEYKDPVPPLARVVSVDKEAWPFDLVRERGRIVHNDLVLTWEAGQASALDTPFVADGNDVGNVVVQRRAADGSFADAVHDISFAFAFRAFHPDGTLYAK